MATERAGLQPAGAPVSEEVVVVACVPASGLCMRVKVQNLQTKIDRASPSVPPWLWRALMPRPGAAPALGMWHGGGSGGTCGHRASRASGGRSFEMTARVMACLKQTTASLGCCRQGRARHPPGPGPGENQTGLSCHYMSLM